MIALLVTAALTLPLSLKSKKSVAKSLVFLQVSAVLIWLCSCFDLSKGEGATVVEFRINPTITAAAVAVIALLFALFLLQRKKGLSKKVLSKLPCALFIFEGAALLLFAAYMYFLFTPADKDNALNQLYALLHGSLSQSSGSAGAAFGNTAFNGSRAPGLGHGRVATSLPWMIFPQGSGTHTTHRKTPLSTPHTTNFCSFSAPAAF